MAGLFLCIIGVEVTKFSLAPEPMLWIVSKKLYCQQYYMALPKGSKKFTSLINRKVYHYIWLYVLAYEGKKIYWGAQIFHYFIRIILFFGKIPPRIRNTICVLPLMLFTNFLGTTLNLVGKDVDYEAEFLTLYKFDRSGTKNERKGMYFYNFHRLNKL